MRIYNKNKTQEIYNSDLKYGYLRNDKLKTMLPNRLAL